MSNEQKQVTEDIINSCPDLKARLSKSFIVSVTDVGTIRLTYQRMNGDVIDFDVATVGYSINKTVLGGEEKPTNNETSVSVVVG